MATQAVLHLHVSLNGLQNTLCSSDDGESWRLSPVKEDHESQGSAGTSRVIVELGLQETKVWSVQSCRETSALLGNYKLEADGIQHPLGYP